MQLLNKKQKCQLRTEIGLLDFTPSLTHLERLRKIRNLLGFIRTKNVWISLKRIDCGLIKPFMCRWVSVRCSIGGLPGCPWRAVPDSLWRSRRPGRRWWRWAEPEEPSWKWPAGGASGTVPAKPPQYQHQQP